MSESILLAKEPLIRFGVFFGVLVVMVLWEAIAPCRSTVTSKPLRWLSNVGLVVLNTIVLRLVFPFAAVGLGAIATERSWGFFNTIALPYWLVVALSALLLDLVIYWQHVVFHQIPILWRLHKVHHADLDFDVTTGLRFHPLEILLSMGIKCVVIVMLGAPAVAVLLFELVLNATSMFNHGNVSLPGWGDRVLRWFLVTPNMHRIHHSAVQAETNSNYGFSVTWWDRLFQTYRAYPLVNQREMTIGLFAYQQDIRVEHLHWMLLLPFLRTQHSSE